MAGRLRSLRTRAVADSASKSPELEPLASTDPAKESAHNFGKATRTGRAQPNSRRSNKRRAFRDPASRKKHPESTPVPRAKPQLRNCATQDECGQASSTAPARL